MNKYGIVGSFLLILSFLSKIPMAIIFDQSTGFTFSVGYWLPLDLFHINGIRYFTIGAIDDQWALSLWFAHPYGWALFILFWILPLISLILTLIFSIKISENGVKGFKASFALLLLHVYGIFSFPTLFGPFLGFPVYLFSELSGIIGYGTYLAIIALLFLFIGLKKYQKVEDDL